MRVIIAPAIPILVSPGANRMRLSCINLQTLGLVLPPTPGMAWPASRTLDPASGTRSRLNTSKHEASWITSAAQERLSIVSSETRSASDASFGPTDAGGCFLSLFRLPRERLFVGHL